MPPASGGHTFQAYVLDGSGTQLLATNAYSWSVEPSVGLDWPYIAGGHDRFEGQRVFAEPSLGVLR